MHEKIWLKISNSKIIDLNMYCHFWIEHKMHSQIIFGEYPNGNVYLLKSFETAEYAEYALQKIYKMLLKQDC